MPTEWRGFMLGAVPTLALLWLMSGCPGQIDDPNTLVGEIDCVAFTNQLIDRSCSISGCHDSVTAAGGLSLQGDDIGADLLDQPGSNECGSLLISSATPEESLMYTKLTAQPPCGDRMPLFAPAPEPFEVDCMLLWVEAQQIGAP